MKKYYQKKARFNDVRLRNNLPKTKDGAQLIILDEYKSIGTHCITLYVSGDNVTYFDSFRVTYIPKKIKTFIANENIDTSIFKIQANDLTVWGYF